MDDLTIYTIGCLVTVRSWRLEALVLSELADRSYLAFQSGPMRPAAIRGVPDDENDSCFGFGAKPSRPLSCCCGLNQLGGRDNAWVLAMLAVLRMALVERKCVPLSRSSDWFPEVAQERTLTASVKSLLSMK